MGAISTTRDELKTALETITDLRAFDTIPETVNPTDIGVAVVGTVSVEYNHAFGKTLAAFEFPVTLLASVASLRSGQDALDNLLDPSGSGSAKVAIEAGTYTQVAYCRVATAKGLGFAEIAGVQYQGVELTIEAVS